MNKRFLEAVATLIGTTIGAGVLGIPYVVAKSGLAVGLLHIAIIGTAIILLNLLLGEVVLKTKSSHQLAGYAGKYLGPKGRRIMTLTLLFGIYGAMVAYIIGVGEAMHAIWPQIAAFPGSILFFSAAITVLYFGYRAFEESELALSSALLIVISAIIAAAVFSSKFSQANFTGTSLQNIFLPYGVVLFAFLGAVAVPSMKEELAGNKNLLRKAIIIGGLIPILLYALFAIAVVGVSGAQTSGIATISLGQQLGAASAVLANLFAILAMGTSFIALGFALKQMFFHDYGLDQKDAWGIACGVPLFAFLFGLKDFIGVIGVVGAIAGGVEGILIIAMHRKAQKRTGTARKAAALLLTAMLIFGIAYAIIAAARS